MPEEKEIEQQIRSNEVQEILSFIPHWIIRSGIGVILGTIVVLLILTAFVRYPDVVSSRVTILTQVPPASIVARSSGNISLMVQDNATVEANQVLGFINNPAKFKDVQVLKQHLNNFAFAEGDSVKLGDFKDTTLTLGELQQSYSIFLQQYSALQFFEQNKVYSKRIASLTTKVAFYQKLTQKYRSQKNLLEKELEISLQKLENDRELFQKGVISELSLNTSESAYLQKKFTLENTEISLLQNSLQLDELQSRIIELKQDLSERKRSLTSSMVEAKKQLESGIKTWEQRYVLTSPLAGKVGYFKVWSDNQFVNMGEEILTIVPQSDELVGKCYVPLFGAGKIKENQKVNIKLDSYPYKEFGMVEGQVRRVSLVPRDNLYVVDLTFPYGFLSTYGDTLEFRQEMQGTADIITEDLTLFERIFSQLRSIFQNQ